MKYAIEIIEGGRPIEFLVHNQIAPIDMTLRVNREPWLRIMRTVLADDGTPFARDLGVLKMIDGQAHIEWRRMKTGGQTLTEIAPMQDYLLYEIEHGDQD